MYGLGAPAGAFATYLTWWLLRGKIHNPLKTPNFRVVSESVAAADVTSLLEESRRLRSHACSYNVLGGKQGTTLSYSHLQAMSPQIVQFYRDLAPRVSQLLGMTVHVTPLVDKSSCSVLYYEKAGDHIGWHYDNNYYRGRHFTVLVPLEQENCTAELQVRNATGRPQALPTLPGSMIIFEGANTFHRVTPMMKNGERRTVLSMTFCTDPRNTLSMEIARRVKDTAFFGPVAAFLT